MTFEWDKAKDLINQKKHGVSFMEAQVAFADPNRVLQRDPKHSTIPEERYFCYGLVGSRVLTVRFTIRRDSIRIIGAGFWRKGAELYENHHKERS